MRLALLWLQLPEEMDDAFWSSLSESDERRFDAFLSSRRPREFLKELRKHARNRDGDTLHDRINSLPRCELERILDAVLSDKRLRCNLSRMKVEDLRWLLVLLALSHEMLVLSIFSDTIDDELRSLILDRSGGEQDALQTA